MIIFLKKKIGIIVIGIFIFFSIKNLSEFNDFGMLDNNESDEMLDLQLHLMMDKLLMKIHICQ